MSGLPAGCFRMLADILTKSLGVGKKNFFEQAHLVKPTLKGRVSALLPKVNSQK